MTTETTTPSDEIRGLGMAGALLAVSAWGAASVIAKHVDMGGLAVAAYRFGSYGLVVALVMTVRRTPVNLRVMRGSMAGGIALGADVAFFFSAIKLTTVANATVIGALQPVVVAITANRFFGETIRRRDVVLGLVAIVGVVVVVCAGFIARTIYSLLVDCARACRRVRYFFIMRKLKCRRILRTKHKKQVNNAIPASLAKLYDPAFLQKKRTVQRRARALFL